MIDQRGLHEVSTREYGSVGYNYRAIHANQGSLPPPPKLVSQTGLPCNSNPMSHGKKYTPPIFFFHASTRGHFVTFHMKYALVYPDALYYLYEHNGKPWHKSSLEITDSAISCSSIFFYFSSIFCIKSINCFLFSVADNPLHFNNRVSVRDSMCSLSS